MVKIMKENKNVLDELNKGCTMGMNAIEAILDKVEDKKFKNVLKDEYKKYKKIHQKIEDKYHEFSDENPTETNALNKAMIWSMLNIKTIADTSNSKLSEILLQGTNMGIIEGRKLINNKDMDKDIKNISEEFIKMQEESVETLKEYL